MKKLPLLAFLILIVLSINAQKDSAYFLKPGEDPYQKISKNLFLKLEVDRNTCFRGEPVVATYKLYSRLESRTDIIKNPGFYGFTVYDMINLDDRKQLKEILHGLSFDVHIIRKVQLYPLGAGDFEIDAIEVKNRIEFSRQQAGGNVNQEIREGVPEKSQADNSNNFFETTLRTKPVVIHVKPFPAASKPRDFNGATGFFTLSSRLSSGTIFKNEEGVLYITIAGRGNFTQLNVPVIQWPEALEGYEPKIIDSLDKTVSPLAGSRSFRYTFIGNRQVNCNIPPVSFSFFDPLEKIYRSVTTPALQLKVLPSKISEVQVEKKEIVQSGRQKLKWLWPVILILLILLAYIIYHARRQKRIRSLIVNENRAEKNIPMPEEILRPARQATGLGDKDFYKIFYRVLWNDMGMLLGISGSRMNKEFLSARLKEIGLEEENILSMTGLLEQCELGMYTEASPHFDKNEILARASRLMEAIRVCLF